MNMSANIQAQKELILAEALKLFAREGVSIGTLDLAGRRLGFADGYAELIFSCGIGGCLELYFAQLHSELMRRFVSQDTLHMGVTLRIKKALELTVDILAENKSGVSAILNFLSMPHKLPLELKLVQRNVNLIWYDIGRDESLDFNYYSKRLLLHAVYEGMLRYFMVDASDGHADTKCFIDRRIDTALHVGQRTSKALGYIKALLHL